MRKVITTVQVISEAIKEVSYNQADHKMKVTFKSGDQWLYGPLPEHVFTNFVEADSIGKHYHKEIKGRYIGHKVGDGEQEQEMLDQGSVTFKEFGNNMILNWSFQTVGGDPKSKAYLDYEYLTPMDRPFEYFKYTFRSAKDTEKSKLIREKLFRALDEYSDNFHQVVTKQQHAVLEAIGFRYHEVRNTMTRSELYSALSAYGMQADRGWSTDDKRGASYLVKRIDKEHVKTAILQVINEIKK
jgi:hypothetical protein